MDTSTVDATDHLWATDATDEGCAESDLLRARKGVCQVRGKSVLFTCLVARAPERVEEEDRFLFPVLMRCGRVLFLVCFHQRQFEIS